MRHAIKILEQEDTRLTGELSAKTRDGKPKGWRDSEWAMTMGALKRKRLDVFEALQILRGVGKE